MQMTEMLPGPVTNTSHTSAGIDASHLRLVSAPIPFSFAVLPAVPSPVPFQQFLLLVLVEFVGEELMHSSRMFKSIQIVAENDS